MKRKCFNGHWLGADEEICPLCAAPAKDTDLRQDPPKPGHEAVNEALIRFIENTDFDSTVKEKIVGYLRKRDEHGRKKYGTTLQSFNGRDPVADMIEESLDQIVYAFQWRLEREKLFNLLERMLDVAAYGVRYPDTEREIKEILATRKKDLP